MAMTDLEFWSLLIDGAAALLAAIAVLLYTVFWFRDKAVNHYTVFDQTYLEILKLGLERPWLRDPAYTSKYKEAADLNERGRYETYAFICWNFCETIVDKGDEELMKTWGCVIDTENELHRAWFEQPENAGKFKDEFRAWIAERYPVPR